MLQCRFGVQNELWQRSHESLQEGGGREADQASAMTRHERGGTACSFEGGTGECAAGSNVVRRGATPHRKGGAGAQRDRQCSFTLDL